MTPKSSVLVATAFASILGGFDGWLRGVEGCSCMELSLCDGFRNADVVVHAKAIEIIADEASADVILFPDVTYMVEEEDGETYEPEFNFTTSGSSSLCGISLEADGQEYLIDLSRRESTNELRAVGLCGIFKDWDDDDEDVLEAGCSSTPAPTLGAAQDNLTDADDAADSSALRLTAYRGLAAGVACLAGLAMVL
ncbi:unnamed protein product [Pylaiella littoralis]